MNSSKRITIPNLFQVSSSTKTIKKKPTQRKNKLIHLQKSTKQPNHQTQNTSKNQFLNSNIMDILPPKLQWIMNEYEFADELEIPKLIQKLKMPSSKNHDEEYNTMNMIASNQEQRLQKILKENKVSAFQDLLEGFSVKFRENLNELMEEQPDYEKIKQILKIDNKGIREEFQIHFKETFQDKTENYHIREYSNSKENFKDLFAEDMLFSQQKALYKSDSSDENSQVQFDHTAYSKISCSQDDCLHSPSTREAKDTPLSILKRKSMLSSQKIQNITDLFSEGEQIYNQNEEDELYDIEYDFGFSKNELQQQEIVSQFQLDEEFF